MAETVKYRVATRDGKVWGFVHPSCGDPREAPLSEILTWLLEQMNLGNWHVTRDEDGRGTSLTVGLVAAADAVSTTEAQVADRDALPKLKKFE
jgi:hypothetical protein